MTSKSNIELNQNIAVEKEKNFIKKFSKANYVQTTYKVYNGVKTKVLEFRVNYPKRHDFRRNFDALVQNNIKSGLIFSDQPNFDGTVTFWIAYNEENCQRAEVEFIPEKTEEIVVLTENEKNLYNQFMKMRQENLINYDVVFVNLDNTEMSKYKLGALISTLTEKGLIKVTDKKHKIIEIVKFA